MQRRSNIYAFTSLGHLKKYFVQFLSIEDIEEVIEQSKNNFVVRRGCSGKETELQFIKKCEFHLLRQIREMSEHSYLYMS